MIASQLKYVIVGNRRVPDPKSIYIIPNVKEDEIRVILPEWFRGYIGRRFVRIYGTQLICIAGTNENEEGYYFDYNILVEATLHSNIARYSNTGTLIEPFEYVPEVDFVNANVYDPTWGAHELINELYDGYILIANNFCMPKVYVYNGNSQNPLCNFLLFKIECELMTIYTKINLEIDKW
jgi:hypothetical protein